MRKTNKIPLTVIIPVYNVERYVADCLDSVLAQKMDNMEILCVEDHATDGSLAILKEYAKKDKRIRILRTERNSGLSAARNLGTRAAKGAYLYYLDSDDMLRENSLPQLYQLAEEHDLDGLFFDQTAMYEDDGLREIYGDHDQERIGSYHHEVMCGEVLLDLFLRHEEWSCMVQQQLWKRRYLEDHDIRFCEGYIHEDGAFSFKATILANKVMYVNEPCFIRRYRHGSIMTSSNAHKHVAGCAMAYLNIAETIERYDIHKPVAYRYLANMHYMMDVYQSKEESRTEMDSAADIVILMKKYIPKSQQILEQAQIPILELPDGYSRLLIYGAGKIGRKVYRNLLHDGKMKELIMGGFLVTDRQKESAVCMGAPVISIGEYKQMPGDLILVAVGRTYKEEIIRELKKRGIAFLSW